MKTIVKINKFLFVLSFFALVVILLIFILIHPKDKIEKIPQSEEVEYTKNILKNSDFESIDLSPWIIEFEINQTNYCFLDNLVKYSGKSSLNISSEKMDSNEIRSFQITQSIKDFPKNKKLILNGYIRTEFIDKVFLQIMLYNINDSLLACASTDTLSGTNDWTFLTTWVRTHNPELSKIKIACVLQGKGRAWFDKLELYPIDIKYQRLFRVLQ